MPTFRDLHYSQTPLLIVNAWDVGSALALATAGFTAIGTTSFGIAASAGLPDGDRASQAATVQLVAQLCRLPIHVTADIEDGWSDDPDEVAQTVVELATLGAAGVNIEDSRAGHLVDPVAFAAKVAAVKRRTPNVFVNARVDNLWFGQEATVEAVVLRALAYAHAGADGIFVPGLAAPEDIRSITDRVGLPVNVLAHPALTVGELGKLGVSRVSSGSLPYRAAVDAVVTVAHALRDSQPVPVATSYWELQSRLVKFNEGAIP